MEHMSEFIGKDFANWANGDTITLLGAYKVIRYNDYSTRASSQSMMMTISRQYYANYLNELFVRVKDNMDRNFMENLMKDAQHNLRFANFYISNVKSFDDIRANHQQGNYIEVRNDYIIMIFLSVEIYPDCHTPGQRRIKGRYLQAFRRRRGNTAAICHPDSSANRMAAHTLRIQCVLRRLLLSRTLHPLRCYDVCPHGPVDIPT